MDGAGLTARERRSLREMEEGLRSEAAGLDRRLRELRVGPVRRMWEACGKRVVAVAVSAVLSLALLVAGIRTGQPVVIWAFAASWTLTSCGALTLLCTWVETAGWTGGGAEAPPEPPC